LEHIQQFVTLWKLLSDIHLVHEEADTIHWKFTNNGKYSASSAYKMQFGYLSATTLNASIWNVGQLRTAKKLHGWLCKIEFRRRNSRRKKGWPNCEKYLSTWNQFQESATQVLYKCRFSKRIWNEILSRHGINDNFMAHWDNETFVKNWWTKVALEKGKERKTMDSMSMLTRHLASPLPL
jgi:hypothetical protein